MTQRQIRLLVRLQMLFWHGLLRLPYSKSWPARANAWVGGYWKRGLGISAGSRGLVFPYRNTNFHGYTDLIVLQVQVEASPYVWAPPHVRLPSGRPW